MTVDTLSTCTERYQVSGARLADPGRFPRRLDFNQGIVAPGVTRRRNLSLSLATSEAGDVILRCRHRHSIRSGCRRDNASRRYGDSLVHNKDVIAQPETGRIHVENIGKSYNVKARLRERRVIAGEISVPIWQRLGKSLCWHALIWSAVEVPVWEAGFEVAVLLERLANPARGTTPSA